MKLSSAPALRYCCAPRPYWRLPTPVNGSKATSSRRSSTMAYRKPPSAAIVPNDQADQPGVQVVGHCANDTFKITYTRNSDSPAENDAQ